MITTVVAVSFVFLTILGLGFLVRPVVKRSDKLDFSHATVENLRFPTGFVFGAASAAHQIEGGTHNNNWTWWEGQIRDDGRPGILTGEQCGDAADHWNRFEEDLELMKALNLSAYRFSIEWSRIQPEPGVFLEEPLERYRTWCISLSESGITPVITLHHFTEPVWITEAGGFENRNTVEYFAEFVRFVVPRVADVCDHWITINEPVVWAVLGWMFGEFPPGIKDPVRMTKVLENLLLAHARAYHLIHELDIVDADGDGVPCEVGLAKNVIPMVPERTWHPGDLLTARILDRVYNDAVWKALETGTLKIYLPGKVRSKRHIPGLRGAWDVNGINHYTQYRIRFAPKSRDGFTVIPDPSVEKNDMGWDLYPQSFYDALNRASKYGKPIWVTENGTCDAEENDRRRQRFILECCYAMMKAMENGSNVTMYLHWSIMDNFEWAHGFVPRFGLYRVNYESLERKLTGGGSLYADIIGKRLSNSQPDAIL